ncbi:hypothetical protein ACLB2K_071961 [Fragaria x ananassa]
MKACHLADEERVVCEILTSRSGEGGFQVPPQMKNYEHKAIRYSRGFGGVEYSEVKHVDARAIPRWVTYWEASPELPETKPGFGGVAYSEVKHVDARAIPGWVTYWEAAPELPETKP